MPDLLLAAVANNADWCAAMAAAHGNPGRRTPRAWCCDAPMPPFYPNAVTLAPGIAAEELLPELPDLPGGYGLKDSFRDLELGAFGFAPLFEAEWIGREAGGAWPGAEGTVRELRTPEDLERWVHAWGETPAGTRIFVPALLADPRVAFLAAEADGAIVAGLAALRSAGVVGYSNGFGTKPGLTACLAALDAGAAGRPTVGYESPELAAAMAPLGFRPLGGLRVWATRGDPPVSATDASTTADASR